MILFWDQRIRTIYSYVRKTVVQPVMKKDTIYKRSANIIWEILSMFLDMVQLLSDLTILTHFRGYKMASVFYMVGMLALNWLRDGTKASFWPRKGISKSFGRLLKACFERLFGPKKKGAFKSLKRKLNWDANMMKSTPLSCLKNTFLYITYWQRGLKVAKEVLFCYPRLYHCKEHHLIH